MPGSAYEVPLDVVERAATPERVGATVAAVAGRDIAIGPLAVGPGRLSQARATGVLREVPTTRDDHDGLVGFVAALDLQLDLDVLVTGRHHGYVLDLVLPVHLVVASATAAALQLTAAPPDPREVRVRLSAKGLQARLLAKVGNVEQTVREEAAAYVRDRLELPDAQAAMRFALTS